MATDWYSEKRETEATGKTSDSKCKDLKETLENVFKIPGGGVYLGK